MQRPESPNTNSELLLHAGFSLSWLSSNRSHFLKMASPESLPLLRRPVPKFACPKCHTVVTSPSVRLPAFLKCTCGHRFVCDPPRAKFQSRAIVLISAALLLLDVAATIVCWEGSLFAQKGIYAGWSCVRNLSATLIHALQPSAASLFSLFSCVFEAHAIYIVSGALTPLTGP